MDSDWASFSGAVAIVVGCYALLSLGFSVFSYLGYCVNPFLGYDAMGL